MRKTDIFLDDGDREAFLRIVGRAKKRYRCFILAVCLMTNHFHLIVQVSDISLSRIMKAIMTAYAMRYNRKTGSQGHVFERRFFRKLVRTELYLGVVIRYVHGNPVAAGLVERSADWPWSSARQFSENADGLADLERVRELIGDDDVVSDLASPVYELPPGACIPDGVAPCFAEDCAPGPDLAVLAAVLLSGTTFRLEDLRGPGRRKPLANLRKLFFQRAVIAGAQSISAGRFLNRPPARVAEALAELP